MSLRDLRHDEVIFQVICEPEEDIPIEGNALASGDEQADRAAEQWIKDQLERGNEWAWCSVKVLASWKGFRGYSHLGACSYESRESFMQPDGYYPQLKADALDDLNAELRSLYTSLEQLRTN